jgi:hypothetical protein
LDIFQSLFGVRIISGGGSGKSMTIGVDKFTMGVEEGIGRREGR